MQGDAEIVIRRTVRIVDEDRVLVVRDGILDRAVLEQQVCNRRERGGAARVCFERRDQLLDRPVAVAAADRDDGALVAHGRDLGGRGGKREGCFEGGFRGVEPAALELVRPAREGL